MYNDCPLCHKPLIHNFGEPKIHCTSYHYLVYLDYQTIPCVPYQEVFSIGGFLCYRGVDLIDGEYTVIYKKNNSLINFECLYLIPLNMINSEDKINKILMLS